jgi:putative transposase
MSDKRVIKSKNHVVFCPKYHRKVLDGGVEKCLKEIIDQVSQEQACEALELEVMPDHVHGRSSRPYRQEFLQLKRRLPTLWTHSDFIYTVGGDPIATLKQYIENQKTA